MPETGKSQKNDQGYGDAQDNVIFFSFRSPRVGLRDDPATASPSEYCKATLDGDGILLAKALFTIVTNILTRYRRRSTANSGHLVCMQEKVISVNSARSSLHEHTVTKPTWVLFLFQLLKLMVRSTFFLGFCAVSPAFAVRAWPSVLPPLWHALFAASQGCSLESSSLLAPGR